MQMHAQNRDSLAILKTPDMSKTKLEWLKKQLNCEVIHNQAVENISDVEMIMMVNHDGILQLMKAGKSKIGPVYVDFSSKTLNYRRKHGGSLKQALARAVGIKGSKSLSILDVTAGFGTDAFIIASLGCKVTLIERCKVVMLLLEDGIKRAEASDELGFIKKNMQLNYADSCNYLIQLNNTAAYDVIYLDPMFPEKNKNAAVKKEMQYLQEITKNTGSDDELLHLSIKNAHCRVVVKRPLRAPFLADKKPSHQIKGKSCRFDVYLT